MFHRSTFESEKVRIRFIHDGSGNNCDIEEFVAVRFWSFSYKIAKEELVEKFHAGKMVRTRYAPHKTEHISKMMWMWFMFITRKYQNVMKFCSHS